MTIKTALIILCLSFLDMSYAQVPNTLSVADKIYGLSKFWQEVNYNFVYLDKIGRSKWDSAYVALIPEVEKSTNDYEYYRLLEKFCALLHDGHTDVGSSGAVNKLIMQNMYGPYLMSLRCIENMPVVERTLKSKLSEIPIGSEVVEVNGIDADRYMRDSVEPYISGSTEYERRDVAAHWLIAGMSGMTYRIKLKKPDGTFSELTLTHARTNAEPNDLYPPVAPYSLFELKWYPHDIAYVALNSFGDPKIDTMFVEHLPKLYKAKGLIIDLRNNGGGSTGIGTDILKYLTNDTILYHASTQIRFIQAYRKAVGKYIEPSDTIGNELNRQEWLLANDSALLTSPDSSYEFFHLTARRLVVPTAILVSHNTASAAEDFLISAHNQSHMVRIGQNSYGSTGQPESFNLPGGGYARVCIKKDTYPDGTEFVGKGIPPDIAVELTIKDFIAQKDPVLDRAVVYLKDKLGVQ